MSGCTCIYKTLKTVLGTKKILAYYFTFNDIMFSGRGAGAGNRQEDTRWLRSLQTVMGFLKRLKAIIDSTGGGTFFM